MILVFFLSFVSIKEARNGYKGSGGHVFFAKYNFNLSKGNVSFYHHLASVNFSHFNLLLSHMNWNLVGSIYGRFSIKIAHFVPIHLQTATTGNSCFWLAYLKKSSPLKPLSQMNWNLVGSIYGRPSIKNAHFVPIR